MKVEKRDGGPERQILIGMLVNDIVLGAVASKWEPDRFRSKWANLVGSWCVKYYSKYEKAPRKEITRIFQAWADKNQNDATIQLVEKFLESLSGEYANLSKEINPESTIDFTQRHFNRTALLRLSEGIASDLESDAVDEGLKRVESWGILDLGVDLGVDLLQDAGAIRAAFADKNEPLFTWQGDLGRFFDNTFARDSFVAFVAPEKRGKTFWLGEVVWQAMLNRQRVAFFAVGDMTQSQMVRRFMSRATRRPIKPGIVTCPKKIKRVEKKLEVVYVEREFKHRLSWRKGVEECNRIMLEDVKSNESFFKLSTHPTNTLTVAGIKTILRTWERQQGWVPAVVVIDYADILAPMDGRKDEIGQVRDTWARLRALSQEFHNLVVTATQANTAAYSAELMTMANFSQSKSKNAFVTAMIGLNQTASEKPRQLMRLNFLNLREGDFNSNRCVYVGTCLGIANPAVVSMF